MRKCLLIIVMPTYSCVVFLLLNICSRHVNLSNVALTYMHTKIAIKEFYY